MAPLPEKVLLTGNIVEDLNGLLHLDLLNRADPGEEVGVSAAQCYTLRGLLGERRLLQMPTLEDMVRLCRVASGGKAAMRGADQASANPS